MPTPTTYASAKQFLGLAKETTQGTALVPTVTMPVEEFSIDSQFEQLKDTSWRGHMGAMSGVVQGVGKAEFDGKGPVYLDVFPHLLYNILGECTTTLATPNTHVVTLLNTGTAQPPSHCFTHFQGPVATFSARALPGACLSELTVKFDAESELFTCDFKGTGWPTAIATATPTSSPSAILAQAAWRADIGVAGPVSTAQVENVNSFEVTIKRSLKPYYTLSATQSPYIIQRGTVEVSGKATFIADSEAPHLAYLNNTQPQLQIILTNGGSGASLLSYQLDINKANYTSSKFSGGNEAAEYEVEFEAVSTTADATAGMAPAKVTIKNSVASY